MYLSSIATIFAPQDSISSRVIGFGVPYIINITSRSPSQKFFISSDGFNSKVFLKSNCLTFVTSSNLCNVHLIPLCSRPILTFLPDKSSIESIVESFFTIMYKASVCNVKRALNLSSAPEFLKTPSPL